MVTERGQGPSPAPPSPSPHPDPTDSMSCVHFMSVVRAPLPSEFPPLSASLLGALSLLSSRFLEVLFFA